MNQEELTQEMLDEYSDLKHQQIQDRQEFLQEYVQKDCVEAIYLLGEEQLADFPRADTLDLFEEAAERGHAKARYRVGIMNEMERHLGGQEDPRMAYYHYIEAAKLGVAEAIYEVGRHYYEGLGVEQNYAKSVKYLELAAQENSSAAMYLLSECYAQGHGVQKNLEKALEYAQKAYTELKNQD